ncbi:MAG: DUF4391 domain-containing protein [Muribaculaceae bacterium]|nr:DUF4391 domain-containing protein [Muribaculaceae bacterium]
MFGLPDTTAIKKQLPKKAIYAKFDMKPSQRNSFDVDVSRIDIVAVLSQTTMPAIAQSDTIKEFYVLAVQLKRKEYIRKNIELLFRLIPQNMLFALQFEGETQFAVNHTKYICSEWQNTEDATIKLSGINLQSVWNNLVATIGGIEVESGNTIVEQIKIDDAKQKIRQQISILEKKMAMEKQPKKKFELHKQIMELKNKKK